MSFVVSRVAMAASRTAFASSVTAPLSRKVFTAFLAEEDTSRILFAVSLTALAACSGVISLEGIEVFFFLLLSFCDNLILGIAFLKYSNEDCVLKSHIICYKL